MNMDEVMTQDQDGFHVETANAWIRCAKKKPLPRVLFGEFWSEKEMAILFGDTGKGKSVLAVQIAESIARGRHIEPLEMAAGRRTVVYLDLEMTDKQFEMRYAADHAGGRARFLHNHYAFSDNFHRVEVDLTNAPVESSQFAEYFVRRAEEIALERNAEVLIIDNITFLKRSQCGMREMMPLMLALDRLKKRTGLSILLVANSQRRVGSRLIGLNDLQESRLLGRFADTVFAIGEGRRDNAERYIKHVKQRSNILVYDTSHVPAFRLKKIGGNFLGFEFKCFAPENEVLDDVRNEREWETIDKIKKAADGGASIRMIAAEMGLPKTQVHRLLQMWRPPLENSPRNQGAAALSQPAVPAEIDRTQRWGYFPGVEEYDEAKRERRFANLYESNDHAGRLLAREYGLIESATARARKTYEKTGVAPRLADDLLYAAFIECIKSGGDPFAPDDPSVPSASSVGEFSEGSVTTERTENTEDTENPKSRVRRSLDGYGREIFIEKDGPNGKPDIWYNFDSNGRKRRMVRKGNGVIVVEVE